MPILSEQEQNQKEWYKCSQSVIYFAIHYVLIQHRGKLASLPFEPWEHIINLFKLLMQNKNIIVLKSRQVGVSWAVVIFCVWKCLFHKNVKVLMISQGQDVAWDLIYKAKFIINHLPPFLKVTLDPDQKGEIGFPDTYGHMLALPSTEKAGHGTDATIVVTDEWEFHPYAEENFSAVRPTISDGGQFIGMSKTNKLKQNTFFKSMYRRSKNGETTLMPLFFPWTVRPDRDKAWFERETKDMRPWQIEENYPNTEQEALEVLKVTQFFNSTVLESMRVDCMESLQHELAEKYKGIVSIYKLPVVGKYYCGYTDPSDGKEDPHASIFIDGVTGEEVACSHGMVTADICAMIHNDLCKLYYDAFNCYELNARAGGVFSERIKDLHTPNVCKFLKPDGKLDDKKDGWYTSPAVKRLLIWNLEEKIRNREVTIHSKSAIDELIQFQIPEGDDPQAPEGAHDDYIMAWAGVCQLRKYMPMSGEVKCSSFPYKEQ